MDFRRWFTAFAVLALFTGLASAQVGGGGSATALSCSSVAQVTPTLRAEGITEMVGDIVIRCTGGPQLAEGQQIPTANVTVSLTAPVTSRLLNLLSPSGTAATGQSEALLLIDEPNNAALAPVVTGWGPAAPFGICGSPANPLTGSPNCLQFARLQSVVTPNSLGLAGSIATQSSAQTGEITAPLNVFQGIVVGTNQVQFLGIPILPPGTAGIERVFRITNIRVNASVAGSSIVGGVQQVQALLSTSNPQALPIGAVGGSAAVTVGYVQTSLTTSVTPIGTQFTQCSRQFMDITFEDIPTPPPVPQIANVALLNFREVFPSAFKPRIFVPPGSAVVSTSGDRTTQTVPGGQYPSESGLILTGVNNAGSTGNNPTIRYAGLADTPTQFQAVFAGLPAGATLYVSVNNLYAGTTAGTYVVGDPAATPQPTAPASIGNAENIPYAEYVSGAPSGSAGSVVNAYGTIPVRPINVSSSGTATVVWRITNTNPSALETLSFGLFIAYTPNATLTLPALTAGTASVTLSYNPIVPPDTSNIPRFINLSTPQTGWLTIVPCQTVLLFPYVTSADGFDTGIAISNTAQDPLGTQTSNGSCVLNFYGTNAPAAAVPFSTGPLGPVNTTVTPNIVPTRAILASSAATNFTGYAFAVCDFQFAHGFAFVSDVGARNLAMGYLALVVNNGVPVNARGRTIAGESLSN